MVDEKYERAKKRVEEIKGFYQTISDAMFLEIDRFMGQDFFSWQVLQNLTPLCF